MSSHFSERTFHRCMFVSVRSPSILRPVGRATLLFKGDQSADPRTPLVFHGKQASADVRVSVHVCVTLVRLYILRVSKYVALNGTEKDQDSLCMGKKRAKDETEKRPRNEQTTRLIDYAYPFTHQSEQRTNGRMPVRDGNVLACEVVLLQRRLFLQKGSVEGLRFLFLMLFGARLAHVFYKDYFRCLI